MARLGSESKMGFYPTEVKSIQKVLEKAISFPKREVYVLDSCAGDGQAIESIGDNYKCKTYAVELNEKRAKLASDRKIDVVLNADAINGVRKSNGWVGLNFLNPPYDTNTSGGRLELDFIERWGLTTAIGGVLLLVINPASANEKTANALRLQGYRPMYSFYDPDNADYKNYGQFFVVLQRQLPNFRASITKFISLFENQMDVTSDIELKKIVIRSGVEPQMFKEIDIPRWKVEKYLEKSKLKKVFFDELRQVNLINSSIEHPNEGQAAILIASGVLNKKMKLSNGDEVILKGTVQKTKKQTSEFDDDGNVKSVKLTDSYKTVVIGLNLSHSQFIKYE